MTPKEKAGDYIDVNSSWTVDNSGNVVKLDRTVNIEDNVDLDRAVDLSRGIRLRTSSQNSGDSVAWKETAVAVSSKDSDGNTIFVREDTPDFNVSITRTFEDGKERITFNEPVTLRIGSDKNENIVVNKSGEQVSDKVIMTIGDADQGDKTVKVTVSQMKETISEVKEIIDNSSLLTELMKDMEKNNGDISEVTSTLMKQIENNDELKAELEALSKVIQETMSGIMTDTAKEKFEKGDPLVMNINMAESDDPIEVELRGAVEGKNFIYRISVDEVDDKVVDMVNTMTSNPKAEFKIFIAGKEIKKNNIKNYKK